MFIACLPELTKSLVRSPRLLAEKRLWHRMSRRAAASEIGRQLASQPDIAQITIVAIDAGYRRLGVFQALIADKQTLSKERRSWAIQSSVYKFNQSSWRAFIKAVWIETPELETDDTMFFLHYIDRDLPRSLNLSLPIHEGGIESER